MSLSQIYNSSSLSNNHPLTRLTPTCRERAAETSLRSPILVLGSPSGPPAGGASSLSTPVRYAGISCHTLDKTWVDVANGDVLCLLDTPPWGLTESRRTPGNF